jgi:hypothetical protein
MPEKNDSLIASLQGLLWSAIIGVASFQIIAPNVWGYIHDALAIPYKTAYWIFTLCYFLSLPVYLLVWLLFNQSSFTHNGKILWFLFVFICLQSLGMLITLRWHYPEWFFIALFFIYAVCCGLLLVFYAKDAWRRIVQDHIRRYFDQLVLFTVLSFVLLFTVEFVYIIQWQKDKSKSHYLGTDQSSYYAGNRGFALIDLKDTIDDRVTAIGQLRDSIRYDHLGDMGDRGDMGDKGDMRGTGDSGGIGDAAAIRDTLVDGAFVSYYTALIDLRKNIGQLSSHLANPSREVLTDTIDSIATRVPVFPLNGTGVGGGTVVASGSGLGLGPLQHYRADLRYTEFLRAILQSLSAKVDAESQAQLGLQLRSVQIKGIILLVTLFFTMLSLYIYLSIDQRLQGTTLDFLNDRKRLGEAVPEQMIIDQEKTVAGATSVVNSLWICLTVIVWLLVPLFKPVKDADIDTKAIYKMHTLANWGQTAAQPAAAPATGAATGSAAGSAASSTAGSADSASLALPGTK